MLLINNHSEKFTRLILNDKVKLENRILNAVCEFSKEICELVDKLPGVHWRYDTISMNSHLTIDFLKRNSDKPFKWYHIQHIIKPENMMELIYTFPEKTWNMATIHSIGKIDYDFIQRYYIQKYIKFLFSNNYVTLDLIKKLGLKIDFSELSKNVNLTYEFIKEHISEPWDWNEIARNDFENSSYRVNDKNKIIEKAIIPLQIRIMENYWNPENEKCRQRLLESYKDAIS
jgi:hypothetical protein